ncbi:MAG: hypothetical protein Ct9H300mP14_16100 [Gammaproteobacteria bacterium]|nr:MAG: hypothetical protein Ct9H300mP14_16100 [Gammaproteobacteria bacterium]
MQKRGYDETFARNIYHQILGFGEYGFPESHAASFALLVYISAWLKHHHPATFTCALLNSQPMGFYAPAQLDGCPSSQRCYTACRCLSSNWDCTLGGKTIARYKTRASDGKRIHPARRTTAGFESGARSPSRTYMIFLNGG